MLKRIFYQAVLHGIVMNIIYMPIHITFTFYNMIPIPILPNPASRHINFLSIIGLKCQFYFPHYFGQLGPFGIN